MHPPHDALPRGAEPGTTLELAWTLTAPDGATRRPFGAGGVFVELRDAGGGAATIGRSADASGHYRARVTVPAGGIGAIAIGLEGRRYASGNAPPAGDARGVPAPLFFPIDNDPFAGGGAGGESDSGPPWTVLFAGLALLGLLLAAGRAITVCRAVA